MLAIVKLRRANRVDAQAFAGNPAARRRQRAIRAVAQSSGFDAASATSAALTLGDSDTQIIREDMAEVRDIISAGDWPAEFSMYSPDGAPSTVTLENSEQAEAMLARLESLLTAQERRMRQSLGREQSLPALVSRSSSMSHRVATSVLATSKA